MRPKGAEESHDAKSLFRRLDALYDGATRGSKKGPTRWPRFLDGFFTMFREELGLASATVWIERRGRLACVHAIEELLSTEKLELARALASFSHGERVFLAVHDTPPSAGLLIEDDRRIHLMRFNLRSGVSTARLQLVLSTISSALSARLVRDRLHDTLHAAMEIQRGLLPSSPATLPGFEIAGRSVPAEEVGGDFYDHISFGENALGLAVGDASGHGLPAALVVRDVVVGLRMGLEQEMKAGYILSKLNRVIHRSSLTSSFVSLFYGELEDNGNLFYYNAGHEPPLLFQGENRIELARGDTVIGPLPDVHFKRHFAHVDRGSTLVLYTDGIIERRAENGDFFGIEGLARTVSSHISRPAAEIVDFVFKTAAAFGGDARWEDDSTLVVVKRRA